MLIHPLFISNIKQKKQNKMSSEKCIAMKHSRELVVERTCRCVCKITLPKRHSSHRFYNMLCCQKADTFKGTSRPKCLLILRLIGATIDSTKIGRNKLSIPLNASAAKRSSRDTSLAFMFYRFLEHILGIIFRQMKNRTS